MLKPVKTEELDEVLKRWFPKEAETATLETDASDIHTGDEDVLDPAVLESLHGLQEPGEPDILAELAGLFLEGAAAQIGALRKAVEAKDAQSVLQLAHALKGSNGNMGDREVARTCQQLKEAGKSGDMSSADNLLDRLETGFARARSVLEEYELRVRQPGGSRRMSVRKHLGV